MGHREKRRSDKVYALVERCRLAVSSTLCGWEGREGEEEEFFFQFSPKAYALGINIVLYALTH